MKPAAHLQAVQDEGLPEYPISVKDQLDSHYFTIWNRKLYSQSTFKRRAYRIDPEVGFFARELYELSYDQRPIGTLPRDDEALSFILGMSDSRWRELRGRDFNPLYGWYEVLCDDGSVRLANKTVTEVAKEALKSHRANRTKLSDDRERQRQNTIKNHLISTYQKGDKLATPERLAAISDWISEAYPGGSATIKRVKEAFEDLATRG